MLHNRYYEEYESDFQYELRQQMNSTNNSYIPIYLTPSGEWYYDEPSGDYIVLHVNAKATQSNINAICRNHMDAFQYPF